jgi:hypothetical protein
MSAVGVQYECSMMYSMSTVGVQYECSMSAV